MPIIGGRVDSVFLPILSNICREGHSIAQVPGPCTADPVKGAGAVCAPSNLLLAVQRPQGLPFGKHAEDRCVHAVSMFPTSPQARVETILCDVRVAAFLRRECGVQAVFVLVLNLRRREARPDAEPG